MTTVRDLDLAFMACSCTNVRLLDLSQHQFQPQHPGSNMILNCLLVSGVKAYRFLHVSLVIIFGPERDEVTREWRKLHNDELNDLYCSPNTFRVVKSKRIGWVGHAARMGERRGVIRGFGEET